MTVGGWANTPPFGAETIRRGWDQFGNGWMILDAAIVLSLAVFLGALIAYHPAVRAKVSTPEELEQPKTFIMYSVVAAVVAIIVVQNESMAWVVFGIGGLMRFRTNVGEAKDTGRVILATVVGLCCGIKIYVVAVMATAVGWLVIYLLERQTVGVVHVKGLGDDVIVRAAQAYQDVVSQAGCRVVRETKNLLKGKVSIVFQATPRLDRTALEEAFKQIPDDVRGVFDLDVS